MSLEKQDAEYKSVDTERQAVTREWNDAIVAHPDGRTVQEALDAATDGDRVVVVGSHDESSVNIPDTSLEVIFWADAEINNTATDGSHTLVYPDKTGPLAQIWWYPKLSGNSSSGKGLHTPSTAKVNQFGFMYPDVQDHGGTGLHIVNPISSRVSGTLGGGRLIENNGQGDTTSTNIRVKDGVNTRIDNLYFGGQADRHIWLTDTNGLGIGPYVDNGCADTSWYLEGNYRLTMQGPIWFEGATNQDIWWGPSGSTSVNDMKSRPSQQVGTVKWSQGVNIDSDGAGKSAYWQDRRTWNKAQTPAKCLPLGLAPSLSTDITSDPQFFGPVLFYRSDLSPPELRALDQNGTVSTLATF